MESFLADSKRACQDLQFEILHAKSEKSVFSGFPVIWKFLQIWNGLAKTVNLMYYVQKVIFGAPDGPDPPDGAGAGVGGQGEVGPSPLSPAWPADHFYV